MEGTHLSTGFEAGVDNAQPATSRSLEALAAAAHVVSVALRRGHGVADASVAAAFTRLAGVVHSARVVTRTARPGGEGRKGRGEK